MNYAIEEIEGIGPACAEKLAAAGIKKTGDLLDQCGAAKGRKSVSERSGIPEKLLLTWANMADRRKSLK